MLTRKELLKRIRIAKKAHGWEFGSRNIWNGLIDNALAWHVVTKGEEYIPVELARSLSEIGFVKENNEMVNNPNSPLWAKWRARQAVA
jgi:hypothetical protein